MRISYKLHTYYHIFKNTLTSHYSVLIKKKIF